MAAVTSATLSFGVMATLSGGPTTLVGTSISARSLGKRFQVNNGDGIRGGFCTTVPVPLTRTTLLSLAETASCAAATEARVTRAQSTATKYHQTADIKATHRSPPPPSIFLRKRRLQPGA